MNSGGGRGSFRVKIVNVIVNVIPALGIAERLIMLALTAAGFVVTYLAYQLSVESRASGRNEASAQIETSPSAVLNDFSINNDRVQANISMSEGAPVFTSGWACSGPTMTAIDLDRSASGGYDLSFVDATGFSLWTLILVSDERTATLSLDLYSGRAQNFNWREEGILCSDI